MEDYFLTFPHFGSVLGKHLEQVTCCCGHVVVDDDDGRVGETRVITRLISEHVIVDCWLLMQYSIEVNHADLA